MLLLDLPIPRTFETDAVCPCFSLAFETKSADTYFLCNGTKQIDQSNVCTFQKLKDRDLLPLIFTNLLKSSVSSTISASSQNKTLFMFSFYFHIKNYQINRSLYKIFATFTRLSVLRKQLKINEYFKKFIQDLRSEEGDENLFSLPQYEYVSASTTKYYRLNIQETHKCIVDHNTKRNSFADECIKNLWVWFEEIPNFTEIFDSFIEKECQLPSFLTENQLLLNLFKSNLFSYLIHFARIQFYREFNTQVRYQTDKVPFILNRSKKLLSDLQHHLESFKPKTIDDANELLCSLLNSKGSTLTTSMKKRKTRSDVDDEEEDKEDKNELTNDLFNQNQTKEEEPHDSASDEPDLLSLCEKYLYLMKSTSGVSRETHDAFHQKTLSEINSSFELKKLLRSISLFLYFHTNLLQSVKSKFDESDEINLNLE